MPMGTGVLLPGIHCDVLDWLVGTAMTAQMLHQKAGHVWTARKGYAAGDAVQ